MFLYNGLSFILNDSDSTAIVTNSHDVSGIVNIPFSISFNERDYIIKIIEDNALYGNKKITWISYPENSGITHFGDFSIPHNQTKIMIPPNLESLSPHWCDYAKNVTELELSPDNIHFIIEDDILYNKEMTILYFVPRNIADRGKKIVLIPDSVKEIWGSAFSCSNIEYVLFSEKSQLNQIHEYAFNYCLCLTKISIPKNVNFIGANCFFSSSLKSIECDGNHIQIGKYCFQGCNKLKKANFLHANKLYIDFMAFDSVSAKFTLYVKEGTTINGNYMPKNIKYKGDRKTKSKPSLLLKEMVFENIQLTKEIRKEKEKIYEIIEEQNLQQMYREIEFEKEINLINDIKIACSKELIINLLQKEFINSNSAPQNYLTLKSKRTKKSIRIKKTPPNSDFLKQLRFYSDLSNSSYDTKTMEECCGKENILYSNVICKKEQPVFYIINMNCVLYVIIRGSYEPSDFRTDMEFKETKTEFGIFHSGFLNAACFVFENLKPFLNNFNGEYIRLIGHSYGASVSQVLHVMIAFYLQQLTELVTSYAFGPLPSMNLSSCEKIRENMYTFVNNNDIIPTMSIPNCYKKFEFLTPFINKFTTDEAISIILSFLISIKSRIEDIGSDYIVSFFNMIYDAVPDIVRAIKEYIEGIPKYVRYVSGQVFYLKHGDPKTIEDALINQEIFFDKLSVSFDCISDHSILNYIKVIEEIKK